MFTGHTFLGRWNCSLWNNHSCLRVCWPTFSNNSCNRKQNVLILQMCFEEVLFKTKNTIILAGAPSYTKKCKRVDIMIYVMHNYNHFIKVTWKKKITTDLKHFKNLCYLKKETYIFFIGFVKIVYWAPFYVPKIYDLVCFGLNFISNTTQQAAYHRQFHWLTFLGKLPGHQQRWRNTLAALTGMLVFWWPLK